MPEEKRATKMFWIDMEMTGLDPIKDRILEVAIVITDLDLKTLDTYHAVVYQPQEFLAGMDKWCTDTHGKSGLTKEVASGRPLEKVESEVVDLVIRHFGKDKIVLCGNSVGQDRKFIEGYMPKLSALLHYRLTDISSFKEVFRNKYGIEFKKKDSHRAAPDIHESIAELAHYLSFVTGKP